MRRTLTAALLLATAACSGEAPSSPDSGPLEPADSGMPPIDSGAIDSGTEVPDAGFPDTGTIEVPAGWSEFGGMPESAGRWGTRMVHIPSEDRFLMFGGSQYPLGTTSGEFWSFSLLDGSWTLIEAGGSIPEPRYCHCATYLPEQHQMLMVGGRDDSGPRAPQAFVYDIALNEWTELGGPLPRGVIGCHVEWMENLSRAAVFGGAGGATLFVETWLYDPTMMGFSMVATSSTPPGRADGAHAYDPINGRMLLFGGGVRVVPPLTHLDDLWAFDGTDWRFIAQNEHPPKRRFSASGVDPETGSWYLYGGTVETEDRDDLWRFDFATDKWTQLEDPDPPARGFSAGDWDPRSRALHVFGGLIQPNFSAASDGWRFRPE